MSKALVTGGTGFIGLYVVKLLLEQGGLVNTTVRSLKNPAKVKPLLELQATYPDKLSLFEADLMKNGSFTRAMEGCKAVYHVASPFLVPQQIKDGIKDCVKPALQGTKNVLQSVNDTESVKRVVLTSSIAAIYGDSADVLKMKDATLSESYWNETSTAAQSPYSYSKMIAEREAWKMQETQTRWDLVVINPGMVLGPSLSPESASGSLFMLENMYRGDNKIGTPELHYPIADVRYIIASDRSVSLLDMANFVRPVHQQPKLLPSRSLPKFLVYATGPFIGMLKKWVSGNIGIAYHVDNSKSIRELGMTYRPMGEVVRSHYQSWLSNNPPKH